VRYYEAPGFGHAITGAFMPRGFPQGPGRLGGTRHCSEASGHDRHQCCTRGEPAPSASTLSGPLQRTGDPNLASSFKCLKAPGFHGYGDDDDDDDD